MRRRVQQRAPAGRDPELRPHALDVGVGGLHEDVVAGVAALQRLVGAGIDALEDRRRVRVLREREVPAGAAAQQRLEVAVGGVDRPALEVGAHQLQRRAVVGHQVHRAGALDEVVGVVDVVDEHARPGEDVEVLARPGDHVVDAGGESGGRLGVDDPHRADPGHQLARGLVDPARVVEEAPVPVRGEHGEVRVDRLALPGGVVPQQQLVARAADPGPAGEILEAHQSIVRGRRRARETRPRAAGSARSRRARGPRSPRASGSASPARRRRSPRGARRT